MPKPIKQVDNGLYLYQSLLKDNDNIFSDFRNYKYYMNGIIKHIKAINAYTNPTTNSYKRSIHLPSFHTSTEKCKLSFPDTATNPYLCAAVILMAGLDGIQNKTNIGKRTTSKLFE